MVKRPCLKERETEDVGPPAKVSLIAAVFVALYGVPYPGSAQQQSASNQQQSESPSSSLQEIVVTAQRREQTVESVPYNISVVSPEDLDRAGVTDIASLATLVPGLSAYNLGTRLSAAQTPIIRGINASQVGSFRLLNQSPVGVYIGNSPIDGYFQFDDVQRIEVLRGPQGTLYGAGALGGAIRIIPNAPELDKFSGQVAASGGTLAHSSGIPYTMSGMLNVPAGDTLAFRVSGKYDYQPGFIDVYGLEKRSGSSLYGSPVLADPADPVNSPPVFYGKSDWNYQGTFTGRASMFWKPADKFNAELGFMYADTKGAGAPNDSPAYQGGPFFLDPSITFPSGGTYRTFAAIDQPYSRKTALTSLDMSYDVGFATLSSTSSYYTNRGDFLNDYSFSVAGIQSFAPYYAGNPVNPRFIQAQEFADDAHTFTQEVRLVSKTSADKKLDYVVGVFYEDQVSRARWDIVAPGSYQRSVAQGCTAPFSGGGTFPNCLLIVGPNDTDFTQTDVQEFQDKSVFGELSWHFVRHGQVTFGGRHFTQSFTDSQSYLFYPFATFINSTPVSSPASKNTWKINPSYEYSPNHFVYAVWSQGFRRGGSNALPQVGFFAESPLLLKYGPDETDNYEVGVKGHSASGYRYTFALYDIEWGSPQINGTTPDGGLAVWNAGKARSRGVEFEASGPLFVPGLSFLLGGYYGKAELIEGYSLPGNNFAGMIVPGLFSASGGDPLPGSPKDSLAATLTYERNLGPDYELSTSLNYSYQAPVPVAIIHGINPNPPESYSVANLSISLNHVPWRIAAYCTNLTDRVVNLATGAGSPGNLAGNLNIVNSINLPREIGLRIRYSF